MEGLRKNNPRKTAVQILNRVDEKGAFAEPLLDDVLSRKSFTHSHDRKLLTQLVYGTLRMRGRLDWMIGRIYRGDEKRMDTVLMNILRIGLYQILFTDRIPDFAAVDEAVEIAKEMHPRGAGLVNAVLRTALRRETDIAYPDLEKEPAHHVSIVHSHPRWLADLWISMLGVDETIGLCSADNETPPLTIRVNRLKTTRDRLGRDLIEEGYEVQSTAFSPDGLNVQLPGPVRGLRHFREGYFQIQDEASQMIAYLLDPLPGERIMDVCSGSGIKTTHLAERMGNQGSILAVDVHQGKLAALKGLAGRLGITIIKTLEGDARLDQGDDFRGAFDRVLVDAPCSGLGTLRRNPEIKWRLTSRDMAAFLPLQKEILGRSAFYLKRGGILVYSTCTIAEEENEEVVDSFLAENRDFRPVRPPASIDKRLISDRGFFQTFPHRHGTDGFFGAVLMKS
jgi:16S rRNA (cytosine967-C5)-methyltransferase